MPFYFVPMGIAFNVLFLVKPVEPDGWFQRKYINSLCYFQMSSQEITVKLFSVNNIQSGEIFYSFHGTNPTWHLQFQQKLH